MNAPRSKSPQCLLDSCHPRPASGTWPMRPRIPEKFLLPGVPRGPADQDPARTAPRFRPMRSIGCE